MHLKISDLEQWTGISKPTLRYYESIGLVSPVRREGSNYRNYTMADLVRLVQVKQINTLGLQLSELPGEGRNIYCEDVYDGLKKREHELESEIEQAIDQLGRLRLHIRSFGQAVGSEHALHMMNSTGNYRIFPLDEEVKDHPDTPEIIRKWMALAPHTYSVVRVKHEDLAVCGEENCPASVGIGLMKHVFDEAGDTFRPPMQYSPVGRCIQGVIETPSLDSIPVTELRRFLAYLTENTLIPLDDFYGWVIYAPPADSDEPFRLSMRLPVA